MINFRYNERNCSKNDDSTMDDEAKSMDFERNYQIISL